MSPETPERVQLNKALVGFLSHCGYAHGGNGYEGIAFLLDQFRDAGLENPTDPNHGLDLKALATRYTDEYARYKSNRKNSGSLDTRRSQASTIRSSRTSRLTLTPVRCSSGT